MAYLSGRYPRMLEIGVKNCRSRYEDSSHSVCLDFPEADAPNE